MRWNLRYSAFAMREIPWTRGLEPIRSSDSGVRNSFFGVRSSDFVLRHSEFIPRNSFFGIRSSEFGVHSSEFVLRNSFFGVRSSFFGIRSSEWIPPRPVTVRERMGGDLRDSGFAMREIPWTRAQSEF